MLVMLFTTLVLGALAVFAVAKATAAAMHRLGLDPMNTLLWLGLAEWPGEAPPPRPPRVRETAVGQPARPRRRSPHRRLNDVVSLTARGILRGHEGVREAAAFLYEAAQGHRYAYHLTVEDDRMAMLEWSAEGRDARIVDGVDSYLIEDGKIKAQTIHYRVESRDLSVTWDAVDHAGHE